MKASQECPKNAPTPPSERIMRQRVAALCLNSLIKETNIGSLAYRFDSEDPEAWMFVDDYFVKAVINNRTAATLQFITANTIHLTVNNIFSIIRPQHIKDFNPPEHGITVNTKRNWRMDKEDDISIEWSIPDEIPGLERPWVRPPRKKAKYTPKIIS